MTHKHSLYDSDMHFLIDPASRSIKNQSKKTVIVRGDHNSERFTFELPRTIEGHDMSLCNLVQVHYINVAFPDVDTIDDLQVYKDDDTVVVFSWKITENSTQFDGNLAFAIHFYCVNDDGKVDYAYRTIAFKEITVADTIDNVESIKKEYPNLLAEWEARLNALENDDDYVLTEEDLAKIIDSVVDKIPELSEVPTKVSQLENDAGYITLDDIPDIEPTDYVTPEMYGAAGNGIKDDTDAIQEAMNIGKTVVLCGDYAVSQKITCSTSHIYGKKSKINLLNDIETVFELNNTSHVSGLHFDCQDHNVKHCLLSTNSKEIEIKDVVIKNVHNTNTNTGASLISISNSSNVNNINISDISVENCRQIGNGTIGDEEGNLTCIYARDYTEFCRIQNVEINGTRNFEIVDGVEVEIFEDVSCIYTNSSSEYAETSIKNVHGYNYGKRLIKTQCAGCVTIDGVTAYTNSVGNIATIGLLPYNEISGKAIVSNCYLTNEYGTSTNSQYLLTSNVNTTVTNCVFNANDIHWAVLNNHNITMTNCQVKGLFIVVQGEYTHVSDCFIDADGVQILREWGAVDENNPNFDPKIKFSGCTICGGEAPATKIVVYNSKLFIDDCWIDWCSIIAEKNAKLVKLTNSTLYGSRPIIATVYAGELIAENLTLFAKKESFFADGSGSNEYGFEVKAPAVGRFTNINATDFRYDIYVNNTEATVRGVNMTKVHCKSATSFNHVPEYVDSLPNRGLMAEGVKVILKTDDKMYQIKNGAWEVIEASGGGSGDYILTESDKTEIAQQAASLIDTALLSALGSGVIE